MKSHSFNVKVDVNTRTGQIQAVYFRIREGKPTVAREIVPGIAFTHHNSRGDLVGVELLGPCQIDVLTRLVPKDEPARRFIRESIPAKMVA